MITQLSISHFKAIASATIPLGPITVLVGPNDAGKSTILQALMALSRCGDPRRFSPEQLLDCSPAVAATHGDTSADITLMAEATVGTVEPSNKARSCRYMATLSSRNNAFVGEEASWDGTSLLLSAPNGPVTVADGASSWSYVQGGGASELSRFTSPNAAPNAQTQARFEAIAEQLRSTMLRLDARAIAQGSPLGARVLPDGSGVVGIVDDLLTSGVGDEQIARANDILRRLYRT